MNDGKYSLRDYIKKLEELVKKQEELLIIKNKHITLLEAKIVISEDLIETLREFVINAEKSSTAVIDRIYLN